MPRPRLAVLVAPVPCGWPARIAAAIRSAAHAAGFAVEVMGLSENPVIIPSADVVIAQVYTRAIANVLARLKVPLVNIDGAFPSLPFPRVGTDPEAIGRLAAEHLLEQGCRDSLALLNPDRANSRDVVAGFVHTMAAAGAGCRVLPCDPLWRSPARGSDAPRRDDRRVRAAVAALPLGAGVFAWSDSAALAVLDLIAGTRAVPGDLRLIAGGDDEALALAAVPISAVRMPDEALAEAAVRLAGRALAGEPRPVRALLLRPFAVVARASTVPALAGDPAIAAAQAMLARDLSVPLGIAHLAAAVGLPRRTLERRYRAVLGCAIHADLTRLRLLRARELLLAGTPVAAVAAACGFARVDTFARTFRQVCGAPPSRWVGRHSDRVGNQG